MVGKFSHGEGRRATNGRRAWPAPTLLSPGLEVICVQTKKRDETCRLCDDIDIFNMLGRMSTEALWS